jgi:hypothetical protein
MRTIDYIHDVVLPGAYQLLPPRMASRQADALLLAIGLQESRFQYRGRGAGAGRRRAGRHDAAADGGVLMKGRGGNTAIALLVAMLSGEEPWRPKARHGLGGRYPRGIGRTRWKRPHQGAQECARRRQQMAAGRIPREQMLTTTMRDAA